MKDKFFLLCVILILSGCSLNHNSKFWNDEANNTNKIIQNNDNDNASEVLNKSYNLMKKQVIDYGKKKDFPDINK